MQNGAQVELAALQLFQHQYKGTKYKPTTKYIFLSPTAEMIAHIPLGHRHGSHFADAGAAWN
jgi:hypothetical protein